MYQLAAHAKDQGFESPTLSEGGVGFVGGHEVGYQHIYISIYICIYISIYVSIYMYTHPPAQDPYFI